jgi:hypothetical protein
MKGKARISSENPGGCDRFCLNSTAKMAEVTYPTSMQIESQF